MPDTALLVTVSLLALLSLGSIIFVIVRFISDAGGGGTRSSNSAPANNGTGSTSQAIPCPAIVVGSSTTGVSSSTPVNVSVDGGWSNWVNEGTCVNGSQTQKRTCTNPAPLNNGSPCLGSVTQVIPCPVDGGWSGWSDSTNCDKPCGGGTKTQTRHCTNPAPANGGLPCVGSSSQTITCNTDACPVDGGWTDWVSIGSCSKPCDGGSIRQVRTCTNPEPKSGGAPCSGESFQDVPCNTGACWYKLKSKADNNACLKAVDISGIVRKKNIRFADCAEDTDNMYWQVDGANNRLRNKLNRIMNTTTSNPSFYQPYLDVDDVRNTASKSIKWIDVDTATVVNSDTGRISAGDILTAPCLMPQNKPLTLDNEPYFWAPCASSPEFVYEKTSKKL
jgi:hypothetical protein